ncbi:Hypothetical Protein RSKD131_3795 [Cereibacter sphaeroides KD131]|nr:Hypothetical Protein RSKD131_3795 [Cereibacter sphaeroides KD131]
MVSAYARPRKDPFQAEKLRDHGDLGNASGAASGWLKRSGWHCGHG